MFRRCRRYCSAPEPLNSRQQAVPAQPSGASAGLQAIATSYLAHRNIFTNPALPPENLSHPGFSWK
jgi:hypothetical protein